MNKFKSFNKQQKIVLYLAPVALILVILFIAKFIFKVEFSETESNNISETETVDIVPFAKDTTIYSSKIEAYEAQKRDSLLKETEKTDIDLGILFEEDIKTENKDTNSLNVNTNLLGLNDSESNESDIKDEDLKKTLNDLEELKEALLSEDDKEPVKDQSVSNSTISRAKHIQKQIEPTTTHTQYTSSQSQHNSGFSQASVKRRKKRVYNSKKNEIIKSNKVEGVFIKALTHSTQKVKSNSTLKIRVLEDFTYDGITIQKNSFIWGIVNFAKGRIKVDIKTFSYKGNIYKINAKVFDMDGIEGIAVPESVAQKLNKEGEDAAVDKASEDGKEASELIGTAASVIKSWNNEPYAQIPDNYKILLNIKK